MRAVILLVSSLLMQANIYMARQSRDLIKIKTHIVIASFVFSRKFVIGDCLVLIK